MSPDLTSAGPEAVRQQDGGLISSLTIRENSSFVSDVHANL